VNYNKLPYPLFKITLNEATMLVLARKHLNVTNGFLCNALMRIQKPFNITTMRLRDKIMKSIEGKHENPTIPNYFQNDKGITADLHDAELRKVWIDKLLKHNGYK
jgi:hypothetical protein